jgi:hypothetical protein
MAVIITGNNTPTAGGITYGDGTTYANTAAGTSGQLLQSNGASAPTWVTASSGALVFLSTVTASSSATVDIETTFNSTYNTYVLFVNGVLPGTSNVALQMLMKIGGSYLTTATYATALVGNRSDTGATSASGWSYGEGQTASVISPSFSTAKNLNFQLTISNPSGTVLPKFASVCNGAQINAANINILNFTGAVMNTGTGALTGLRFQCDSGNIASGTFRLYGVANS